ncbi:hypothetical protein [Elizabethkingia anophelis]
MDQIQVPGRYRENNSVFYTDQAPLEHLSNFSGFSHYKTDTENIMY